MKKTLLVALLSLLCAPFGMAQIVGENMIENFENTRKINYGFVSGTLNQPINNPYLGLGNTSSQVGQYVRSAGTQYDVIVCNFSGNAVSINDYVAGTKKFSMKVYTTAPVGTNVELTFQNAAIAAGNYPTGRHSVYLATTTVTNNWETLVFNFTSQPDPATPAGQLDQMVISFNNNSFTGDTYTFDDLAGVDFGTTTPPVTNEFLWANFGTVNRLALNRADGSFAKTANPARSPIHNSDSVARYIRSNVQYDVLAMRWNARLQNLADYRANTKKFSVKVYSPAAGTTIQFTLQDSIAARGNYPSGRYSEFTGVTTTTNQWETVVLNWVNTPDASVADANVNELAILFNSNTFAPITIFMDSLYGPQFAPTSIVGENMIENFENTRKITYGFVSGTLNQPINNPNPGPGNTSTQVGQYVRSAGTQYDVIVCNFNGNAVNINDYVTGAKKFSMKLYTTAPVGTNVELTFQNAAIAAGNYPVGRHSVYLATTTVTNAWETLVFNFSNQPAPATPAGQLDQMVISFNNNSFTGDTYTFDDLAGVDFNTITPPVTNEFLWANFGTVNHLAFNRADGAFSKTANPARSPMHNSDSVARYIRSNVQYDVLAMRWNARLQNLADYRANTKKFSAKVYSPAPGTTIQFTLQDSLAARGNYPAGRYSEFTGVTTTTNQWETVVLNWVNTPDASVADANVNELAILFNSNTFAPITIFMDSLYGPLFTPTINGLGQSVAKTTVRVYPQPAGNQLNIVPVANEQILTIEARDITGRTVISQPVTAGTNGPVLLNTAHLATGMYQLQVKTTVGVANSKIVVEK